MNTKKHEENRVSKNLDYMHTFRLLTIFVIVFFIICFIIFAFIPEQVGFSLSTGGWDWLSFVGGLAGVLIASWGVIVTIKNNQEMAIQQAALSVKPILNIAVFNNFCLHIPCNLQGVYLPYSVSNGEIIVNDDFLFLSNMTHNFENDSEQCLLQIKNIGLGSAMNICVRMYKILNIAGQSPSEYEIISVEEFYNNVKFGEPLKRCDMGSITSEVFYEIPQFHLNNSADSFNIVMGQRTFSGDKAYYIFELKYQDAYENINYVQYHHLLVKEKMCMYFSTSAQKIVR